MGAPVPTRGAPSRGRGPVRVRVTGNGAVWRLHVHCRTKGLHRPLEASPRNPGGRAPAQEGLSFLGCESELQSRGPGVLTFSPSKVLILPTQVR